MNTDLQALIQLAASGNSRTVEELWITAVEQHTDHPAEMASWAELLKVLVERDRLTEAEALAWTAVEAVLESQDPAAALQVAIPFLQVLNKSAGLRRQVAELYAQAYADRENLAALLEEAGVAGGRPPRRALRTMEVCLELQPGTFLAARYEEEAVRVESIDSQTWQVTIETRTGQKTLGPVELADAYAIAPDDHFVVLRSFAPERLRELLEREPARVVIGLLQAHDGNLDSNQLAEMLTPELIPEAEWTKWWSKTRTALRRKPHVRITGRSPYELSYDPQAASLESETEASFKKRHDPLEQLGGIEAYLRECKARSQAPDLELLGRFHKRMVQAARRRMKADSLDALTALLAVRAAAVAMGTPEEEADAPAVSFLADAANPVEQFQALPSEKLWPAACGCLRAARPDTYVTLCEELLPLAPMEACDMLAGDLVRGRVESARLEALLQQTMKHPVRHVETLAWLWKGPDPELNLPVPPLPALCAKLIGVATALRRRDEFDRETARRIQNRVRDSLSAGRYARFKACLDQSDAAVAATWRIQIGRLDSFGRAVPEDLTRLIHQAFPEQHRAPQVCPWKREDVLYMTTAGRRRLSGELDELVNVKMRENAKAIGEAASHGDLSENSEYKFALEERDLLRARLARMQEQMSKAVVLEPWELPEGEVAFGTRVRLRRTEDGQVFELTFLGPWETDVDRAIYNYHSPIGQQLMGLPQGATVNLEFGDHTGTCVIEGITNVLQEEATGTGPVEDRASTERDLSAQS